MIINGIKIVTHGKHKSKVHKAWQQMLQRTTNPNNPDYAYYMGRGIKNKFTSFEQFFLELGHRPDGMSLDRIDNDKGYEPGNVRWATRKEQSCNTRLVKLITHKGITDSYKGWSIRLGASSRLVSQRINKFGWDPIKAITTPKGKQGPK